MTPQPAGGETVSGIYELLRFAAARRQPVAAIYDGLSPLLCPDVLGRKSGRLHALFYQFGGNSSSGLPVTPEGVGDWRSSPWRNSARLGYVRMHGAPSHGSGGIPASMKSISMSTLSRKRIRSKGNGAVVAVTGAPE